MPSLRCTIITPSYNSQEFITECITSVLMNDPDQYIIIDGGSTDDTISRIQEFESDSITYISEEDSGQSEAVNKGLIQANGDIINWINSDDVLKPGALQTIKSCFQANVKAGLVHGQSVTFGAGSVKLSNTMTSGAKWEYLSGMNFPQPSAFFTRKAIEKIGLLDENLHHGMDFDFYVRIALNFPVVSLDQVLSSYRLHSGSKTCANPMGFAEDWKIVFNRVVQTLNSPPQIAGYMADLGLMDRNEGPYRVAVSIDDDELEQAFLYFLKYQIYYRYEGYDFQGVKRILKFLRGRFPRFYKAQDFGTIHSRLKLGRRVVRTARSLFR